MYSMIFSWYYKMFATENLADFSYGWFSVVCLCDNNRDDLYRVVPKKVTASILIIGLIKAIT